VKVVSAELTDETGDLYLFVNPSTRHFLNYPEQVTRLHAGYGLRAICRLRTDMLVDWGRYFGPSETPSKVWFNWNVGISLLGRGIAPAFDGLEVFAHIHNIIDSRPSWPVVFQQSIVTAEPRRFRAGVRYSF